MPHWTICTGEYPPDCGGVGDYTAQVAAALAAAGDRVAVCVPEGTVPRNAELLPNVEIVELPDRFGPRARQALASRLDGERSILLVQYVPNAFGARGANVPWCRWLLHRSQRIEDDVRVMFHEPYFYFDWLRPDRCALAFVQRGMTALLLRAAGTVYLSTSAWLPYLHTYAPPAGWNPIVLPIPSSIPRDGHSGAVQALRRQWLRDPAGPLVGHFGTYGDRIAPMLRAVFPKLLAAERSAAAVFVGRGSYCFAADLIAAHPLLAGRVHATGRATADEAASAVSACDLVIQPFPDGVTTRRTSVMAGLANGRPVLTTSGRLTEPEWFETGCVSLTPAGDANALVAGARALLADAPARIALAVKGDLTYRARFALEHTIAALRRPRPDTRTEGGAAA